MKNINNNRDYTKPRENINLNPWYITGLTDAEGNFNCSVFSRNLKNNNNEPRATWHSSMVTLSSPNILNKAESTIERLPGLKLEFKITQKEHSEGILHEIQSYFKCGSVVIDNRLTQTKKFRVSSISDIVNIILPHFKNYPLKTSKNLNFKDFDQIASIINKKKHLSEEGIFLIKKILENMNSKRSFEDKYLYCKNSLGTSLQSLEQFSSHQSKDENFEKVKLSPCGITGTCGIKSWIQGFLDGEGSFYNYFNTSKNILDSSLEVGQNSHDVFVLIGLKTFFNGGYLKPKYDYENLEKVKASRSVNRYILRDIEKINQFFQEYPLLTRKQLDYLDWKKIVEIKLDNGHLSQKGQNLIKEIKLKMNSNR